MSKPHIRKERGFWLVTEHRHVLQPAYLDWDFSHAAEVARWLASPPAWQSEPRRTLGDKARAPRYV